MTRLTILLSLLVNMLVAQEENVAMTAIPQIIAHRGASLEMPENTLSAYQRSIDLGANLIELDVHLTLDEEIVCHHDQAIHGTELLIAENRLEDLRGAFPELPTLQDVLGLSFGSTGLMIELKTKNTLLAKAVTQLLKKSICPKLFLGSFSIDIMQALQQDWPSSQLVGIAAKESELSAQMALKPDVLAIRWSLAAAERIQELLSLGFNVWVWTVDDVATAKTLTRLGAHGVITNDPRSMLTAFTQQTKQL